MLHDAVRRPFLRGARGEPALQADVCVSWRGVGETDVAGESSPPWILCDAETERGRISS